MCVRAGVRVCVRACVSARVRVFACVSVCVCVCTCYYSRVKCPSGISLCWKYSQTGVYLVSVYRPYHRNLRYVRSICRRSRMLTWYTLILTPQTCAWACC